MNRFKTFSISCFKFFILSEISWPQLYKVLPSKKWSIDDLSKCQANGCKIMIFYKSIKIVDIILKKLAPDLFFKNSIPKYCAKFTWKHLKKKNKQLQASGFCYIFENSCYTVNLRASTSVQLKVLLPSLSQTKQCILSESSFLKSHYDLFRNLYIYWFYRFSSFKEEPNTSKSSHFLNQNLKRKHFGSLSKCF